LADYSILLKINYINLNVNLARWVIEKTQPDILSEEFLQTPFAKACANDPAMAYELYEMSGYSSDILELVEDLAIKTKLTTMRDKFNKDRIRLKSAYK
jgi:hypothetical protein